MDITDKSDAAATAAPMPPRRRRSRWRRVFVVFVSVLVLLAASPHIVAIPAVREQIASAIGDELGVRCRIDRLGFSWFTGFAAEGLELGNPASFPSDHPLLRLRRFEGFVDLTRLFSRRTGIRGTVLGVQLFVDQKADGSTNLEALGHHGKPVHPTPPSAPGGGVSIAADADLDRIQLALQMRDGKVELRREGQLLESLTDLTCSVDKPFDSRHFTIDLDTHLSPLTSGAAMGRLGVKVDAAIETRAIEGLAVVTGLDLQRWTPLLEAFAPGKLTSLRGVVNGTISVKGDGRDFSSSGNLVVDNPFAAGPVLGDLVLQAARWQLQPNARVALDDRGRTTIDANGFSLSLGFAQIDAMPSARLAELLAGAPGFGAHITFAAQDLATSTKALPAWIKNPRGNLLAEFAVPAAAFEGTAPWLDSVAGTLGNANGDTCSVTLGDLPVQGAALRGAIRNGRAELTLSGPTSIEHREQSPFQFSGSVDLHPGQRLASELHVRVVDQPLQSSTSTLFRLVMPALAGFDSGPVDIAGRYDLDAQLRGPALRDGDRNWLQLVDEWTGNGTAALNAVSFTPSSALRGLLQPFGAILPIERALGAADKLTVDAFATPWTLKKSTITTTAARWVDKGKTIGLSGTAHLDGALDYEFDLSALLAGHRDGERVLQALGGKLPPTLLKGSVTAPKLHLPDLSAVARSALRSEIESQGKNTLRRALDDLLKKH